MFIPGQVSLRHARIGTLLLLVLSLGALLMTPVLMPASYSWVTHTTSESAAQGLDGAWLARLGFLLFGYAVLWLSAASVNNWARAATWMHTGFGVFMIATAAFSHQPFLPKIPFDPVEDWIHSFAATAMGFAFSLGVLGCFLQRQNGHKVDKLIDMIAIASAIFMPLLMSSQPTMSGLVQRAMFLVAYGWYGREAWQLPKVYETGLTG